MGLIMRRRLAARAPWWWRVAAVDRAYTSAGAHLLVVRQVRPGVGRAGGALVDAHRGDVDATEDVDDDVADVLRPDGLLEPEEHRHDRHVLQQDVLSLLVEVDRLVVRSGLVALGDERVEL